MREPVHGVTRIVPPAQPRFVHICTDRVAGFEGEAAVARRQRVRPGFGRGRHHERRHACSHPSPTPTGCPRGVARDSAAEHTRVTPLITSLEFTQRRCCCRPESGGHAVVREVRMHCLVGLPAIRELGRNVEVPVPLTGVRPAVRASRHTPRRCRRAGGVRPARRAARPPGGTRWRRACRRADATQWSRRTRGPAAGWPCRP
jgi:hypothetical protein